MIKCNVISPVAIDLITTLRCNASCERCCFGCRPEKGKTMTLDEMKRYVDICMEEYSDSIQLLSLTGGECFLLGDDLNKIVEYGHQKGLKVSVLSNGYWGTTFPKALKKIRALKKAGLHEIGFSIGDEHQQRIPIENCRNAIVASADAGYRVEVRVECFCGECSKVVDKLMSDERFGGHVNHGSVRIKPWKWVDINNEIKYGRLQSTRWRPFGESEGCDSLLGTIEITPYGDVVACPSLACSRIPYLRLGNINQQPITEIYESLYADALKMWLISKGPMDILRYVYDHSNIRVHYCHNKCMACMEIYGNPKILPFLRETYHDWIDNIE